MTRATVMLGGLGAVLCAFIAYDIHKPLVLRVALCLGVTLMVWGGFVSDFL
jgi:hypothetical protein